MDNVSFFAMAAPAPGPPDVQSAPAPSGDGIDFETLFASLLSGEVSGGNKPARVEPKAEEPEKEKADSPFVFAAASLPVPLPLPPISFLNFSLAPSTECGSNQPAPIAESAVELNPKQVPVESLPNPGHEAFSGLAFEVAPGSEIESTDEVPLARQKAAEATAESAVTRSTVVQNLPVPPIKAASDRPERGSESVATIIDRPANLTIGMEIVNEPAVQQSAPTTEPEPPLATPAQRGISVRLGDDAATSVHVRVAERGGEVHFEVRAASADVAGLLREGLPDLMKSLQSTGYQTEIWRSDTSSQPGSNHSTASDDQGGSANNQKRRRESNPQQPGKTLNRWKSAVASIAQG